MRLILSLLIVRCADRAVEMTLLRRPRLRVGLQWSSVLLRDLDEFAAGVVEDGGGHRAHGDGSLSEENSRVTQPVILGLNVVDAE
jgi:hypothetical protein